MNHSGPDRWLLLSALALLATGVVMVYSASAVAAAQQYGDARHFLDRQLVFASAALILMAIAACIPPEFWHRHALWMYLLAGVALIAVLIPGLGLKIGGARRWLSSGEWRLQPSEFARIALVCVLSRLMAARIRRGQEGVAGLTALPALVLTGLFAGLILLEPDLDTAAALGVIAFALMFLGGVPLRQLMKVSAVLLLALSVLIASAGYRRSRMLAFLSPEADPSGSGYQVRQSLLAVGLGGVSGVGFGESRQKLFFLPAAHTDFIFAVLTEETGLAGGLVVLGLIGLVVQRGLSIARRQREPFGFLMAAGLTTAFATGAVFNLGAVLSVLPPTGICLPLVSYGGSSLLAQAFSIGILLSLSRQRAPAREPARGR